jgi:hypothetical protein
MINSTRALIIYTVAMVGALALAAFTTVSDAVVISFFTSLTGFFTAYIIRRYNKHKLNESKNKD